MIVICVTGVFTAVTQPVKMASNSLNGESVKHLTELFQGVDPLLINQTAVTQDKQFER